MLRTWAYGSSPCAPARVHPAASRMVRQAASRMVRQPASRMVRQPLPRMAHPAASGTGVRPGPSGAPRPVTAGSSAASPPCSQWPPWRSGWRAAWAGRRPHAGAALLARRAHSHREARHRDVPRTCTQALPAAPLSARPPRGPRRAPPSARHHRQARAQTPRGPPNCRPKGTKCSKRGSTRRRSATCAPRSAQAASPRRAAPKRPPAPASPMPTRFTTSAARCSSRTIPQRLSPFCANACGSTTSAPSSDRSSQWLCRASRAPQQAAHRRRHRGRCRPLRRSDRRRPSLALRPPAAPVPPRAKARGAAQKPRAGSKHRTHPAARARGANTADPPPGRGARRAR